MALALVMTGGAVGAIVLPPAAQALIESLGWRGAFAILGALVFAVALPVVVPLVRERPGVDRERRVETEGASVAQAMRSRAFWILIVVLFLFSIGQNGAMTHLSALLTDRGVSASDAAIAVSADGRGKPVGPAGDGLAARPLLRAAPGFLCACAGRAGDLHPLIARIRWRWARWRRF